MEDNEKETVEQENIKTIESTVNHTTTVLNAPATQKGKELFTVTVSQFLGTTTWTTLQHPQNEDRFLTGSFAKKIGDRCEMKCRVCLSSTIYSLYIIFINNHK